MKLRTIIVDDEPHALEIIESHLQHFSEIELVGKCKNAIEAFQFLQKEQIDFMFLDINMPGLMGTDFVKSISSPPKVVFTTAHQAYALEGFNLNAVDYLLKPIPFERFLQSIEKLFEIFKVTNSKSIPLPTNPEPKRDNYLYLRIERKIVKVNVADIYWVESMKDYIKVVLKDRVHISKHKISLLEDLLPEDAFIRIHRSFIAAINKVDSYNSYAIEILGKELPIGRNYKAECSRRFGKA